MPAGNEVWEVMCIVGTLEKCSRPVSDAVWALPLARMLRESYLQWALLTINKPLHSLRNPKYIVGEICLRTSSWGEGPCCACYLSWIPSGVTLETKASRNLKKPPWAESASQLYRPPLVSEVVTTVAGRGCRVVSATDPYGLIIGFLDLSRYFFFQAAPQLY
jgi:hypothetical protein